MCYYVCHVTFYDLCTYNIYSIRLYVYSTENKNEVSLITLCSILVTDHCGYMACLAQCKNIIDNILLECTLSAAGMPSTVNAE